jgi:poly-beta-hydroxyalkanoate depolymerase
MLYQLYEAQRSLMEPLTDFAQAASKLYSNDKSPLSHLPMAQRMAAGYDLLFRLGKDYVKPSRWTSLSANCADSSASRTSPGRWASSRSSPWC